LKKRGGRGASLVNDWGKKGKVRIKVAERIGKGSIRDTLPKHPRVGARCSAHGGT